eukprot:TRINITY_DN2351_c0_g1_i1.p1 TRINITY_DN2351_c0_g1~~TRINITY_DN2351_c0_g1_i1.p1  ORF type:complete len:403 (-),score=61.32 TRINITY_DN2351_c0_g1_i1:480-1688(-)
MSAKVYCYVNLVGGSPPPSPSSSVPSPALGAVGGCDDGAVDDLTRQSGSLVPAVRGGRKATRERQRQQQQQNQQRQQHQQQQHEEQQQQQQVLGPNLPSSIVSHSPTHSPSTSPPPSPESCCSGPLSPPPSTLPSLSSPPSPSTSPPPSPECSFSAPPSPPPSTLPSHSSANSRSSSCSNPPSPQLLNEPPTSFSDPDDVLRPHVTFCVEPIVCPIPKSGRGRKYGRRGRKGPMTEAERALVMRDPMRHYRNLLPTVLGREPLDIRALPKTKRHPHIHPSKQGKTSKIWKHAIVLMEEDLTEIDIGELWHCVHMMEERAMSRWGPLRRRLRISEEDARRVRAVANAIFSESDTEHTTSSDEGSGDDGETFSVDSSDPPTTNWDSDDQSSGVTTDLSSVERRR